jgi:tryptophan-rich sensory protein
MKNPNISGIGGWLVLLIMNLMLFGPLLGFGGLYAEFSRIGNEFPLLAKSPQWQSYEVATKLIFLVCSVIGIIAGHRLLKKHVRQSVCFAIFSLWIVGPLANMAYVFVLSITFDQSIANALTELMGDLGASCLAAGVWTAYLLRSVRVKNTYNIKSRDLPDISQGGNRNYCRI